MKLEESKPYGDLARYTGAGMIFGVTGGVMEASLRTLSEVLGEPDVEIEFHDVRGSKGIKEATYMLAGQELNIAVVHGGASIKEFFKKMKKSKKTYHFVEFMGCIGGCINGGGQPIHSAKIQDTVDISALRTASVYKIDEHKKHRHSHTNKIITKMYNDWLIDTSYKPRKYYKY